MKLSNEAVDSILHVIATFDRERGVPHDYHQLEVVLRNTLFAYGPAGELVIAAAETARAAGADLRHDDPLDDGIEGREMLLRAAREWLD